MVPGKNTNSPKHGRCGECAITILSRNAPRLQGLQSSTELARGLSRTLESISWATELRFYTIANNSLAPFSLFEVRAHSALNSGLSLEQVHVGQVQQQLLRNLRVQFHKLRILDNCLSMDDCKGHHSVPDVHHHCLLCIIDGLANGITCNVQRLTGIG